MGWRRYIQGIAVTSHNIEERDPPPKGERLCGHTVCATVFTATQKCHATSTRPLPLHTHTHRTHCAPHLEAPVLCQRHTHPSSGTAPPAQHSDTHRHTHSLACTCLVLLCLRDVCGTAAQYNTTLAHNMTHLCPFTCAPLYTQCPFSTVHAVTASACHQCCPPTQPPTHPHLHPPQTAAGPLLPGWGLSHTRLDCTAPGQMEDGGRGRREQRSICVYVCNAGVDASIRHTTPFVKSSPG